jgi:putative hydrolase of the HAD superfamily
MIKAVLFDFGGVLTGSGRTGFVGQTLAELYGVPAEALQIGEWHAKLRRGQANDDDLFADLNQRFGKPITKEMFLAKTDSMLKPYPAVYALADALRGAGLQVGILSNIFRMNAEKIAAAGWYDGFDPLILSYAEGYAKPDPEIYDLAVKRTGVQPHEILFVDDQAKCIESAEVAGWHTVCAVGEEQIVRDVKRIISEQNGIEL